MKTLNTSFALIGVFVAGAFGAASAADAIADPAPTFNGRIGSIMHERCGSCHRPGQAAPFSLLTYEDVAKRAELIRAVTQTRYMPPWHAEPGYGAFKGERRMPESEIALIAEWAKAGAPEGSGPAPQPAKSNSEWALGEPDLVVRMVEPFTIPADGPDIYRNFPAPVPTAEDKWIRAIEFRPQARTVVHHSLFKADPTGKATEIDAQDDVPGYKGMGNALLRGRISLGGWAVGGNARQFPEDSPIKLPAGSDFIFESHFHPSGKQETEVSTAAFYFTDKPATRSRLGLQLPPSFGTGAGIDIPAGDANFTISESFTTPAPIEIYGATPHAHYIGKEFKAWADLPDGGEVPLIWVKDWDFAWQDMYVYEEPVILPAGATIHVRIRYDNSADNPRNPSSPPKRVTWGRESEDEMGSISFTALPVNEDDAGAIKQELNVLRKKHREQAARFFQRLRVEARGSR